MSLFSKLLQALELMTSLELVFGSLRKVKATDPGIGIVAYQEAAEVVLSTEATQHFLDKLSAEQRQAFSFGLPVALWWLDFVTEKATRR